MDKLDGRISEEYWLVKHNLWHDEKDKLVEKLQAMNNASRNFDEGSNLLENFCKHARSEFLRATPKKKQAILKMLGSNFVYKDKEVSVELTSVFELLLNNPFSNNGGIYKPKLEPRQFIYKLKKALSQEFISSLKALNFAA